MSLDSLETKGQANEDIYVEACERDDGNKIAVISSEGRILTRNKMTPHPPPPLSPSASGFYPTRAFPSCYATRTT